MMTTVVTAMMTMMTTMVTASMTPCAANFWSKKNDGTKAEDTAKSFHDDDTPRLRHVINAK